MISCPTMGTYSYNSALKNTVRQALSMPIKQQNIVHCQHRSPMSHLRKTECDSQMLVFLSQLPTVCLSVPG